MMWPPVYSFVLQQPVVTLAIGYRRKNRAERRAFKSKKGGVK